MKKQPLDREDLIILLRNYIAEYESDYQAHKAIKDFFYGCPPARSTIGRFRRGEGSISLIAATVRALETVRSNRK